jgi:hypothetical protein
MNDEMNADEKLTTAEPVTETTTEATEARPDPDARSFNVEEPAPIIDPVFSTLLPELTEEESAALEKSLIEEGCRDPLLTWQGILIDGHNRLRICTRRGIRFETKEVTSLGNRGEAEDWILDNQMARRNLSKIDRIIHALKLQPHIAERAKEHQRLVGSSTLEDLAEAPIDTWKTVAKYAGVSAGSLSEAKKVLENVSAEVLQLLKKEKLTIHKAAMQLKQLGKLVDGRTPNWETTQTKRIEFLNKTLNKLFYDVIPCGTDGVLTREVRQVFIDRFADFVSHLEDVWLSNEDGAAIAEEKRLEEAATAKLLLLLPPSAAGEDHDQKPAIDEP